MPAQDRVWSGQAAESQRSGQPPHDGGDTARSAQSIRGRGLVRRKTATSLRQHRELDVLGAGRATRQQDQPEHLAEDQVQQPQGHAGIMSDRQSPLVSDPARLMAPHRASLR
jgi:hypothetical protein